MNVRKFVLRTTGFLALGQVICIAAMIGIFAMLNQLDYTVIVGGSLGGLLAIGNFFLMAVGSELAADKAAKEDVKGGKSLIKTSYRMRLLILGVLLLVFAKSGHCHILALVGPLFFTFPIIAVLEFFRKSGERSK